MSRAAAAVFLLSATVIGLLLVPWTVSSDRLPAALARQIRAEFGVALETPGQVVVAFLPVPRIEVANARLSDADGSFRVAAAQMKGSLRLWPLLSGQVRLADLRIVSGRITLDPLRLPGKLRAAFAPAAGPGGRDGTRAFPIEKLLITGSEIAIGDGPDGIRLARVDAVLRWPDPSGEVDATVAADWRGERVQVQLTGLDPTRVAAGLGDAVVAHAVSRHGRLDFSGSLTVRDGEPSLSGSGTVATTSVGAAARWLDKAHEFDELDMPATLSGDCTLRPSGLEWPAVKIALGADRLDGTLAVELSPPRPQVRATLAGNKLDFSWLPRMLEPSRFAVPANDYDVRLSAADLTLGPVKLADVASGVLVKGDRMELSLARAKLAGGSLRGRLTAVADGQDRDLKGQVSAERIDLARLLGDLRLPRSLAGTLAAHATLEATGARASDLAKDLKGRLTVTADDGEISGLSLNGATVRRLGEATDAVWRGGRTKFGQARFAAVLSDGTVEITDGTIESGGNRTTVDGRIGMDAKLALQGSIQVSGGEGAPPLTLAVDGSLADPILSEKPSR